MGIVFSKAKISCEHLSRNSMGKWYAKPVKVDENGYQNGRVWHIAKEKTRSNLQDEVNFACFLH